MSVESNIAERSWNSLREGDMQALAALYDQHYVGLVNYGARLIGDRDLANDCFIQVLLDLYAKHATLPPVTNVRSYLITCLHRKILLELKLNRRDKAARAGSGEEMERWETSYEDYLVLLQSSEEWKQKLTRAFAVLTERQKELLRLRFFEDRDYDYIAVQCGITRRTAYNIIHDALKSLRAELALRNNDLPENKLPDSMVLMLLATALFAS
ncbi:MAG: sigma-70 family RNA polymerase sigma factor [Candidatus Pseudobacter hemicellulosilyticus]|uniref:Sigma-70 family RNA polymerase sigma factor n=1 Tax=Candidatus Pseudobacter hemicellulosilyticus TaxID=3121375 RepID=A0AAJ6BHS0_9BACT|nr:MAG: sigma-70 family RNA polymerase sigma factor [Pseudobacter sp.]